MQYFGEGDAESCTRCGVRDTIWAHPPTSTCLTDKADAVKKVYSTLFHGVGNTEAYAAADIGCHRISQKFSCPRASVT
jgi:hypothetical protein